MSYIDICVDELSEFIREKQPVILDMRDANAYNSGHIEGALPADETHIRAVMKQKSQPVLICCYHGHSSRELARFLCQMGLTDVYNLEGGWHAVSVHSAHQKDSMPWSAPPPCPTQLPAQTIPNTLKSQEIDMTTEEKIRAQLTENPIILYMKGIPEAPECGFSAKTVAAIKSTGFDFAYVNILAAPFIREKLPEISDWPTYPQLFVNGELVGGCDIVTEMAESDALESLLKTAGAAA